MMLELTIKAGHLSAIYYFLLNVILINVLDYCLSKLLNLLYYRSIFLGFPLQVKSCNIPFITHYNIGSPLSTPNLLSSAVKLTYVLLALTVHANINTGSSKNYILAHQMHSGTFEFDPSEETRQAQISKRQIVQERWAESSHCRVVNSTAERIDYFHIVFNLSNTVQAAAGYTRQQLIAVNDSTILCKSPEHVTDPLKLISVSGCSALHGEPSSQPRSCNAHSVINRNVAEDTFNPSRQDNQIGFPGKYTYAVFSFSQSELQAMLPGYWDVYNVTMADMLCLRTFFGKRNHPSRQLRTSCLTTVVTRDNRTVFDRWEHNNAQNSLRRQFAGPEFSAALNIGRVHKLTFLWSVNQDTNWADASAMLVAEALVHAPLANRSSTAIVHQANGLPRYGVQVPVVSFVLLGVACGFVSALFVLVSLLDRREGAVKRPRLNCIDGLSSIAREECKSSEVSLRMGGTMLIGVSKRKDGSYRLGHVNCEGDAIRTIDSVQDLLMSSSTE